jgi:hypothetical protein
MNEGPLEPVFAGMQPFLNVRPSHCFCIKVECRHPQQAQGRSQQAKSPKLAITALGKALSAFLAALGIGLVAMPTGILAAAFSDALQREMDGKDERGD